MKSRSTSNQYLLALAALFTLLAYALYPSNNANAYYGANDHNYSPSDMPDQSPVSLGNGRISWTARLDNRYYYEDGTRDHFLYINVKGGASPTESRPVPLNLSVVLDRSGSMAGDKLAYAKQAIYHIINKLGPNDYLSIVDYDDVVTLTSPSQPVTNKEVLRRKVEAITARGSTNLTAGTQMGYQQVLATKRSNYVNRVLLLTDGLANVGITSTQSIKQIVQNQFVQKGIALSTFGVGADYNEDLLTLMAETGRGNYYFIDRPERLTEIFSKELNGLLSVLAQNTIVKVKLPAGVTCERVYGVPAEIGQREVAINLNDIYANDERAIVLKLRSSAAVRNTSITTSLSFYDNYDKAPIGSTITAYLEPTRNRELISANKDLEVQSAVAMFKTAEQMDEIMKDADNRNYEQAKVKAKRTIEELRQQQAVAPSPSLQRQEEQLNNYVEDLNRAAEMTEQEVKTMQKSNKAGSYQIRTMKK